MRKMSEALPLAQFHTLEGVGHMLNQEAANQTNQILRTFINQNKIKQHTLQKHMPGAKAP